MVFSLVGVYLIVMKIIRILWTCFFLLEASAIKAETSEYFLAPRSGAFRLGLSFNQTLRLKAQQKVQLQTLITLSQKLWETPLRNREASLGLKGLQAADEILKKHHAVGIVIGSTAAALHKRLTKDEDLEKRSDIDVLVLDPGFHLEDPFEGGIDWFVPVDISYSWKKEGTRAENVNARIYVNGNNVFVRARLHPYIRDLKKGLYLPSRDALISLTLAAVMGSIDHSRVEMEDEVMDALATKLDQLIGHSLSPVWSAHLGKNRIIEESFLMSSAFDLREVAAIEDTTPYRDIKYQERVPLLSNNGLVLQSG